jgi:signal transduction histidine kinase/CHASE3 domain sensor protein
VAYRNTLLFIENSARVTHTHQVLDALGGVLSQLKDAETGQRGYLLTGDERYLAPYQSAIGKVDGSIQRLQRLTADNPRQQRRLQALTRLVGAKLDELRQTVELRRNEGFVAAQAIVLTDLGRHLMEDIQALDYVIEAEEWTLLAQQAKLVKQDARNTQWTLVIGSMLSILLLLGAGHLLQRESDRRRHSEKKKAQALVEMDKRMRELHCLYEVVRIARTGDENAQVFAEVAELMPQGWQYPEIARCRISFDGVDYLSDAFRESGWRQPASIVVAGEARGRIEMFYLEQCPEADEGPFLKEERKVLDNVAALLGEAVARLQVAEERQRYTQELERSNQELDEFAYVASHDLKEPLRGISLYASFLEEDFAGKLDDEGRRMLETLRRLSKRMETLIDNLLTYSRIGRGRLELRPNDLNEVLNEALEGLEARLRAEGAEVRVIQRLPMVTCDRIRIREVLQNLVSNALKYNDSDPKIVEVGVSESEVAEPIIYVRDNGIGIKEEQLDSVFRIFRRLHGRDKYGGGTGAGLTISKKSVEKHNGRIWVESTYGEGSTFYFTIPEAGEAGSGTPGPVSAAGFEGEMPGAVDGRNTT